MMTHTYTRRVGELADCVLTKNKLFSNPYFLALTQKRMTLEQFRYSQEQFYFAVHYFARPMAMLVARMPDPKMRLDILHNIVEEHGDFNLNHSHPETFKQFLRSIGSEPETMIAKGPTASVMAFNNTLAGVCTMEAPEFGIACLGIIEYAFADVSALIGRSVLENGWVKSSELVHYTLHAEIDKRHADEFFALIESQHDQESVKKGLELGAHAFSQLYTNLYG